MCHVAPGWLVMYIFADNGKSLTPHAMIKPHIYKKKKKLAFLRS